MNHDYLILNNDSKPLMNSITEHKSKSFYFSTKENSLMVLIF